MLDRRIPLEARLRRSLIVARRFALDEHKKMVDKMLKDKRASATSIASPTFPRRSLISILPRSPMRSRVTLATSVDVGQSQAAGQVIRGCRGPTRPSGEEHCEVVAEQRRAGASGGEHVHHQEQRPREAQGLDHERGGGRFDCSLRAATKHCHQLRWRTRKRRRRSSATGRKISVPRYGDRRVDDDCLEGAVGAPGDDDRACCGG